MNPAASCRLSDLLPDLGPGLDCPISAISQDSRQVGAGCLFIARAGQRGHGLDYFDSVVRQGAAAILAEPSVRWTWEAIAELAERASLPVIPVERLGLKASALAGAFYGHPSAALRVIGITGTNGKTSCALAIAHALARFADSVMIGTLGNGRPGQIIAAEHTTPDAVELQRLLAGYLDDGVEVAVMEVSSHALDQGRAAAIHFDTAVFTNLSRDHLDYHGDMARYGQAKGRLFQFPGLGVAVINGDDPIASQLIGLLDPAVRLAVYGSRVDGALAARADRVVRGLEVSTTTDGLSIRVDVGGSTGLLRSRWLGRFNAANLLAVLAVLLEQGLNLTSALGLLEAVPVPPGRMEPFGGGDRPLVVVDYAHTPDALEQVLGALREHCQGRLICLFGCGGDRDRGKRPLMGAVVERLADRVIVTDDNPRHESGEAIIGEILAGMRDPAGALVEQDRARAIAQAIGLGAPGDVVAICGKGHETGQRIGDQVHAFNDRTLVAKLLGEASPC